ncbi:ABC-type branched-subunit amino acid transport system substrate-binding protein [Streptomyces luteogriseus]|uniref:ABC-type branched-subunit amino acid transport system substrate-binding protein n=1 Tax=Streptomyces luteogriseus TaxID=68233 RepID=A0A7W7DIZ3_9ACTN|nr:ABC transporter substrate-binding protein [Streptomyces luteogriseus]MBB4710157.1 ABC-type branched-subunit amino acid transport system substrate-binding protein [Streptomyces luteogriseus]
MGVDLPPLDGVHRLTGALDALASSPVDRRKPPVVVFEDGSGLGTRYVNAYRKRLRGQDGKGIVPHAVVGRDILDHAVDDPEPEPDVVLMDKIAEQFDSTMPPLTRGDAGLPLPTYWVCRTVLDTDVGVGLPHQQRKILVRALYEEWQERTPGLPQLRELVNADGVMQKLGIFFILLVALPTQWFYGWWLNRTKRFRWFAQQVGRANVPALGFFDAAVHLGVQGALRHNAALRQSLLLEALAMDLTRATGRGLFNPRRRRRIWPFTVLLPHTGDTEGAPAQRLLDAFLALRTRERDTWPRRLRRRAVPMLFIAASPVPAPDGVADSQDAADGDSEGSARSAQQGANALQELLAGKALPPGTERDGQLTVALGGPARAAVRDWLERYMAVPVRRVSGWSAYAGWLTTMVLLGALISLGFVLKPDPDPPCRDSWTAAGVRVGVDTEKPRAQDACYFTRSADQKLLRDLQDRVRRQNAAVERHGSPYATVVFLAPLTADPKGGSGQLTPPGVLQLRGAVQAMERYNEQALEFDSTKPGLRMLVANVGYAYRQAPTVVKRVNELAADDPTITAVIGIAQSRDESVKAINQLSADLPVIGASVTGDFMTTEAPHYFQTQPTSRHMARALARRVVELRRVKALVIYDDRDRYSTNLKKDLDEELRTRHVTLQPPAIIRDSPREQFGVQDRLDELAARICTLGRTDGITLYAARGNALPRVLNAVQGRCGAGEVREFPFLTADANVLIEYPELRKSASLETFTAVDLTYVAFSTDRHSDRDSGRDAFRAAAAAIGRVWNPENPPRASNVLQQLLSGIEVQDNIDNRRPFTIPPDTRVPAGRPLYLCTVRHVIHAAPSCRKVNGEP